MSVLKYQHSQDSNKPHIKPAFNPALRRRRGSKNTTEYTHTNAQTHVHQNIYIDPANNDTSLRKKNNMNAANSDVCMRSNALKWNEYAEQSKSRCMLCDMFVLVGNDACISLSLTVGCYSFFFILF